MRLLTFDRHESAKGQTKHTLPKVRRPTPKDESEDRQIRREPNAQYRQYGLHECSFCSSPPLRDSFSRDKFLLNHNPSKGVKVPRWNPIGRGTVGRAACSLHQSKGLASGWAVSSLTWARREPSVPGLFVCLPERATLNRLGVAPSSDCHMAVINLSHPQCDWPGAISAS